MTEVRTNKRTNERTNIRSERRKLYIGINAGGGGDNINIKDHPACYGRKLSTTERRAFYVRKILTMQKKKKKNIFHISG